MPTTRKSVKSQQVPRKLVASTTPLGEEEAAKAKAEAQKKTGLVSFHGYKAKNSFGKEFLQEEYRDAWNLRWSAKPEHHTRHSRRFYHRQEAERYESLPGFKVGKVGE